MGFQNLSNRLTLGPIRQALSRGHLKSFPPASAVWVVLAVCCWAGQARGQLVDSLDAYPPRWQLAGSDCAAQIVRHHNSPVGGVGGSGCESMTLRCDSGTAAVLEYRIEPLRPLDDLTARVFVKSAKAGQSIGVRVRFPYLIDPATRQSTSVVIYGAAYRDVGQWQKIGIGQIEKPLRLKTTALRREHGTDADLNDPFVDAIVLNAYTGPGVNTLLIDNLAVDGMVPIQSVARREGRGAEDGSADRFDTGPIEALAAGTRAAGQRSRGDLSRRPDVRQSPFPPGRVTRILQYNGEPLEWVRTLGFDAVLLPRFPDPLLLGEAMRAGVAVFAPPPQTVDPNLTPLLQPVAGYYLGTSLHAAGLETIARDAERLRTLPESWQRPLLAAPAEAERSYSRIADAIIHDLPPPARGLTGAEEVTLLEQRTGRSGSTVPFAVGVQSEAPAALSRQLDAITASIGAPRGEDVFWHSIWLQVARSLAASPEAIVFRSSRSLTGGRDEDQRRSTALSYINRYLEVVGPIAAGGRRLSPLSVSGSRYRCDRTEFSGGGLLIATTEGEQRGLAVAGDGETLRISLMPADAGKIAWRLTHFTAERITPQTAAQGPRIEIVSPDAVETIIISDDPALGARLAGATQRAASRAAIDRWQLTRDSVLQVREDWDAAVAGRIVPASRSALDLLRASEATLHEAEPLLRGNDWGTTLRLSRRADAWTMKSRWQLHSLLYPEGRLTPSTSVPPLLAVGGIPAQLLWWPLMEDAGWGENRLVGGSLDSEEILGRAGWDVGRRPDAAYRPTTEAKIVSGPQIEGDGCLAASVLAAEGESLPGGYGGTFMQIRSPSVRIRKGTPLQIIAQVKTLGFGGADQGVLVYDSVAGPELGVLVRASPQWQTVRLYRQALADGEVNVMLELIGSGEAMIDDVQIRVWKPKQPK